MNCKWKWDRRSLDYLNGVSIFNGIIFWAKCCQESFDGNNPLSSDLFYLYFIIPRFVNEIPRFVNEKQNLREGITCHVNYFPVKGYYFFNLALSTGQLWSLVMSSCNAGLVSWCRWAYTITVFRWPSVNALWFILS